MLPEVLAIPRPLSTSRLWQWRQIGVGRACQRRALLRVVTLNKWIRRYGLGPVEPVHEAAAVGTDLAELVDSAERDGGGMRFAGHPDFAVVQEPERAAQQVGAGELDAGPLGADEL